MRGHHRSGRGWDVGPWCPRTRWGRTQRSGTFALASAFPSPAMICSSVYRLRAIPSPLLSLPVHQRTPIHAGTDSGSKVTTSTHALCCMTWPYQQACTEIGLAVRRSSTALRDVALNDGETLCNHHAGKPKDELGEYDTEKKAQHDY